MADMNRARHVKDQSRRNEAEKEAGPILKLPVAPGRYPWVDVLEHLGGSMNLGAETIPDYFL